MKKLLFDMHVHTSGISRCSRVSPKELVKRCHLTGLDGIVLTNHFAKSHVKGDPLAWRQLYEKEFLETKEEGKKLGLRVLFGIEVTPESEGGRDYLIYGVNPSFLYQEKMLYEYTQSELYDLAKASGALFFQAHPYRNKQVPTDPKHLDGIEINCHPLYLDNQKDLVTTFAKEHDLLLTCGSDYHGDVYKAPCGVYFDENLQTEKDLVTAFTSGNYELKVHDIDIELVRKTNIHQGGKTEFDII